MLLQSIRLAALLAFFSSWGAVNALATPTVWETAAGGNGHAYETVYVTNGLTWTAAKSAALAAGGYLCTITSTQENNFVANLAHGDLQVWTVFGDTIFGPWIGGTQPDGSLEPAGGWTWVTGEPWTFTSWYTGEPNNTSFNEKKLQYYGDSPVSSIITWNDAADNSNVKGYIVEFEPDPIKTSIRVSEVEISWMAFTNTTYHVEYTEGFGSPWLLLSNANCIHGSGTITSVFNKITIGQPQRFFRVMSGGTNCVD